MTGTDQDTRNNLIGLATVELLKATDWSNRNVPIGVDSYFRFIRDIYLDDDELGSVWGNCRAVQAIKKSNPGLYEALKPWAEGVEEVD